MHHVLVTGANGFIGRHLVERLLCDGHRVRALKRAGSREPLQHPSLEWVEGDVCDEVAMKSAAERVDTVFHLAAKVHEIHEWSQDEREYERVNVGGTVNVLRGAEAAGAQRFVFVSSVKAMGEGSDQEQDEQTPPAPQTAYGRSKLRAEEAVLQAGGFFPHHAVCLRLPMVYGPGHKGNLFRMMAAIDRGWFPPWPDIPSRRSMVHVANVVDAACLAAQHPTASRQCYIVADRPAYSTRELYELIVRAFGKEPPTWAVPARALRLLAGFGDVGERVLHRRLPVNSAALEKLIGSAWYSSAKIARDLGFVPRMTFRSALPAMMVWYRHATA